MASSAVLVNITEPQMKFTPFITPVEKGCSPPWARHHMIQNAELNRPSAASCSIFTPQQQNTYEGMEKRWQCIDVGR